MASSSESSPISNEIALRIALAARTLPDTDAARLMRVLSDAIDFPPTVKKLSSLTVKALKAAADGEFSKMEPELLKQALSFLKGESGVSADPLPELDAYQEGDMPDSIRVACASNKDEQLDGHFGSCKRFLIYQVSAEDCRLVAIREVDGESEAEDKNAYRASLINDSQLLFVASIGGPAAAKVVRANIHPIKKPNGGSARDEMVSLQSVIGEHAPPWLAKAMGHSPEQRIRFEQEEQTA